MKPGFRIDRRLVVAIAAGVAMGVLLGRGCGRGGDAAGPHEPHVSGAAAAAEARVWTCSMHPQIRQPAPGLCPICGMDLIPVVTSAGADAGAPVLTLSSNAMALAEVETAPVERRAVDVEVRLAGKVAMDETRIATITARVPGRIDRLYANVTGVPVKAGEHLADLYSPELISAQQELIQAAQAARDGSGGPGAAALAAAARERLRLWGFTAEQIADIETRRAVRDHLTFFAPLGGIVVEKEALEGMNVDVGMRLFTVADLSAVWVTFDAYESDLGWIRYGQPVAFEVESFPGERFSGTVALVDPLLDEMTRTAKVRVNAANPGGRLKPGMFARAVLKARAVAGGVAAPDDLHGKWLCTMHPEVVSDGPGDCRVCGMPLVRAETAGYATAGTPDALPLVIPASAPLVTGTRAVVYVASPDQPGRFEGRTVRLGPRAGDAYIVREGLKEGERVVVRGNFKIDSSLQIEGRPSMMTGGGGEAEDNAAPVAVAPLTEALAGQLTALAGSLVGVAEALSAADLEGARAAAARAQAALDGVSMEAMPPALHATWMTSRPAVSAALGRAAGAGTLEDARSALAAMAEPAAAVFRHTGRQAGPLFLVHCPMAFENRGGSWLQRTHTVSNPFFGAAMLRCGEVVETLGEAP